MSMVTDVVFVCRSQKVAERFQEIVHTHYTRMTNYTPHPVKDNGPKVAGVIVFYHGFNYMGDGLREALINEPWPTETMLWIEGEEDAIPEIRVGNIFARAAVREWH